MLSKQGWGSYHLSSSAPLTDSTFSFNGKLIVRQSKEDERAVLTESTRREADLLVAEAGLSHLTRTFGTFE